MDTACEDGLHVLKAPSQSAACYKAIRKSMNKRGCSSGLHTPADWCIKDKVCPTSPLAADWPICNEDASGSWISTCSRGSALQIHTLRDDQTFLQPRGCMGKRICCAVVMHLLGAALLLSPSKIICLVCQGRRGHELEMQDKEEHLHSALTPAIRVTNPNSGISHMTIHWPRSDLLEVKPTSNV